MDYLVWYSTEELYEHKHYVWHWACSLFVPCVAVLNAVRFALFLYGISGIFVCVLCVVFDALDMVGGRKNQYVDFELGGRLASCLGVRPSPGLQLAYDGLSGLVIVW